MDEEPGPDECDAMLELKLDKDSVNELKEANAALSPKAALLVYAQKASERPGWSLFLKVSGSAGRMGPSGTSATARTWRKLWIGRPAHQCTQHALHANGQRGNIDLLAHTKWELTDLPKR